MNKLLLKRIVNAGSAILAFVMVLVTKVGVRLTVGNETSNPLYKSFFEFLSDYKKADMYGFARFMMWIGFALVTLCMAYFVGLLVLFLLKQNNLLDKLVLVTRVMEFVLIGSIFVLLIAGLDKETYGGDVMVNNITLFGVPWVLSLLFSAVPLAGRYLIKK